jgi:glycerol dehydrogenase
MLSVFSCPSRYTQGKGATAQLGQEMRTVGLDGPALVVAGRSAIQLLSEVWRKSLGDAAISFDVHRFGGECSLAEIERIKASARNAAARVIIAAGGGKTLDAGRATAADLGLPVVNCPTVASSDAPCSALSVIYTEDGAFQQYRIYGRNPDLVLVDTEVIAHGPVRLLVAGMGDALATVFEARTCVEGHVKNMPSSASGRCSTMGPKAAAASKSES